MKKLMLLSLLIVGLAQSGCEFIAGTLVGAGAAGGGYEYQAYRQMEQLEEDHKNKRISREEYDAVKTRSKKDRLFTSTPGPFTCQLSVRFNRQLMRRRNRETRDHLRHGEFITAGTSSTTRQARPACRCSYYQTETVRTNVV